MELTEHFRDASNGASRVQYSNKLNMWISADSNGQIFTNLAESNFSLFERNMDQMFPAAVTAIAINKDEDRCAVAIGTDLQISEFPAVDTVVQPNIGRYIYRSILLSPS